MCEGREKTDDEEQNLRGVYMVLLLLFVKPRSSSSLEIIAKCLKQKGNILAISIDAM